MALPSGVRRCAAAAAGAVLVGGAGVFAAAGGGGLAGYLSEAGVAGAPRGALFTASVLLLAAGLGLLGLALRGVDRLASAALAGAVPFAVTSGAVRCTAGCPLPPFESPTPADLIHAGASIAAPGLAALAVLSLAVRAAHHFLRRVALVGSAVTLPLLAGAGVALVFAGRGALTGVLERASLAALCATLVAVAATRGWPPRGGGGPTTGGRAPGGSATGGRPSRPGAARLPAVGPEDRPVAATAGPAG